MGQRTSRKQDDDGDGGAASAVEERKSHTHQHKQKPQHQSQLQPHPPSQPATSIFSSSASTDRTGALPPLRNAVKSPTPISPQASSAIGPSASTTAVATTATPTATTSTPTPIPTQTVSTATANAVSAVALTNSSRATSDPASSPSPPPAPSNSSPTHLSPRKRRTSSTSKEGALESSTSPQASAPGPAPAPTSSSPSPSPRKSLVSFLFETSTPPPSQQQQQQQQQEQQKQPEEDEFQHKRQLFLKTKKKPVTKSSSSSSSDDEEEEVKPKSKPKKEVKGAVSAKPAQAPAPAAPPPSSPSPAASSPSPRRGSSNDKKPEVKFKSSDSSPKSPKATVMTTPPKDTTDDLFDAQVVDVDDEDEDKGNLKKDKRNEPSKKSSLRNFFRRASSKSLQKGDSSSPGASHPPSRDSLRGLSFKKLTRVFSSSSDSDFDDSMEGDDLEVNDWLDELETIDSLTSTKTNGISSANASSNAIMTGGTNGEMRRTGSRLNQSQNSVGMNSSGGLPNSFWQHLDPDEPDEELEEEEHETVLTPFILENMPVYEVMKQVPIFRNLSQNQQEHVLRSLKPAKFHDGEVIVQQGTRGTRFYMIAKGSAMITKKTNENDTQERLMTYLYAGHYFGEMSLIYDDPRSATVRAVGDVELLYLTQEDFQRISQVHLSLMLQQVPLLSRLNGRDQDIVLSRLHPAIFSDGEYIVRQGDMGDRFYMITKGEAVVTERDMRPGSTNTTEKELTRLYDGHVFGEMSLIYSEPRTASVRAVGTVRCLYLSKEDFDVCLLSDHFQRVIQEAYVEKATRRAMRNRLQQSNTSRVGVTMPVNTTLAANSSLPATPATETKTLVKQRLANGQKVVNKYVIQGDLGRGMFGRVKLCQNEEDKKLYAVKIMQKTFMQRMANKEDSLHDAVRREVAIMKKLNHQNVVKLVEVIDDPSSQKMYLVQEYVEGNLMEEVVKSKTGLPQAKARKYARDLLCGLHYLHFHKVIHRDIKPENILISADGVAKIADFGTARMIMNENETLSDAKGTPAFMAPEMFDLDVEYTGPAVDVWSLGATLYMMVIGHPAWQAHNEIELSEIVQHNELKFSAEVEPLLDPHLKNLLQRMLEKTPELRISLNDCLTHEWITKEGSEPLLPQVYEKESEDITVSIDESNEAIQNIPERIDASLSECLEKANLLVKTRQQNQHQNQNQGQNQSQSTSTSFVNDVSFRTSNVASNASATSSSSPTRAASTSEDTTRIINAWRHHKRVQLMYGHKELSERSRELLLEQKRMAFSVDRAQVTELILPAMPSRISEESLRRDRHSSPILEPTACSGEGLKKCCSDLHERNVSHFRLEDGDERATVKSSTASLPSVTSDADLMRRSLSRKKDFLMVTSEVFRDEEGGLQQRKVLFQARDQDFSVASRVTAQEKDLVKRKSSSKLLPPSGAKKSSMSMSRKASSNGSSASLTKRISELESDDSAGEFKMDGIDCTEVVVDEEAFDMESDLEESDEEHEDQEESDDEEEEDSDYSDVEGDVDVDETFNQLIGAPSQLTMEQNDDEDLLPLSENDTLNCGEDVVQVYVSSKTRENLHLAIRCGYAEAKGSRSYMEDRSLCIAEYVPPNEPKPTVKDKDKVESIGYFAVYDGHNGVETCTLLQKELHHRIVNHPSFAHDTKRAFMDECLEIDQEILTIQNNMIPESALEDKEARGVTGDAAATSLTPISFSGSAAVMALVKKVKNNPNVLLYVANVGDCRAVMCRGDGLAEEITIDHKASHPVEKQRIEGSGGFVHRGRLDGILAISRGFGDFAHKQQGHLVVDPDVYEIEINPRDEFLLLASDGLFDVLSSQQTVNFIRQKLKNHGDVQLAAQEMVLKAQEYFAHDNISTIIVCFNQCASSLDFPNSFAMPDENAATSGSLMPPPAPTPATNPT